MHILQQSTEWILTGLLCVLIVAPEQCLQMFVFLLTAGQKEQPVKNIFPQQAFFLGKKNQQKTCIKFDEENQRAKGY